MPEGSPYQPMKPINQGGIVLFQKTDPAKDEEIVELALAGGTMGEVANEAETTVKPHETFEFNFSSYWLAIKSFLCADQFIFLLFIVVNQLMKIKSSICS